MKKIIVYLIVIMCNVWVYAQVPITNRKHQVKLIPKGIMNSLGEESYKEFLKGHPPLSNSNAQLIKKTGLKITTATNKWLKENGYTELADMNKWEFNLVQEKEVNAWCMPGGKIVFYTGILAYATDENSIAVVMSHEIAHAIAQHGNERMTQKLIATVGENVIAYLLKGSNKNTRDVLLQSYGAGSDLGLLAYSRKHEYEADKIGMAFMALSGYNPQYAYDFWKKMAALNNSKQIEYLSTHPSDENRVKEIKAFLPEAYKYYKK